MLPIRRFQRSRTLIVDHSFPLYRGLRTALGTEPVQMIGIRKSIEIEKGIRIVQVATVSVVVIFAVRHGLPALPHVRFPRVRRFRGRGPLRIGPRADYAPARVGIDRFPIRRAADLRTAAWGGDAQVSGPPSAPAAARRPTAGRGQAAPAMTSA